MAAADESDARGLRFAILGPLQVLRAGQPIALGGPRQRAVLARLLVDAGRTVSVDVLAEALWADAVPPGYRATLQTYVFHLRSALEPERPAGAPGQVLATVPGGYRLLVRKGELDADRFEGLVTQARDAMAEGNPVVACAQLTDALALWRGPVLADLTRFEFIAPFAARLEGLRLDAVEARLDVDLSLGHDVAVAAEATALVRQHPLRERLHALRMLALYRCGRQSEALSAYAELRRVLIEELGVEPSPPLQHLHQQLLSHDPQLACSPAHPPAMDRPAEPPSHPLARRLRKRRVAGAVVAAVVAIAGALTAMLVARNQASSLTSAPPDSVAAVRADGSMRSAIAVGHSPAAVTGRAGSIWVANTLDSTVSRISVRTDSVVQTVSVGPDGIGPVALALLGNDLWVANSNSDNVSEVSTITNQVVATVPAGHNPSAITAGYGAIWVTNQADGTVSEIDPTVGSSRLIDVGDGPDGIAAGDGGVWVANGSDDTVTRIDPGSRQVSSPIRVGAGPAGILADRAAVWVANSSEGTVSRIDLGTGQVTAVQVGDTPTQVAEFGDGIWISDPGNATLSRIDESTERVTRTVRLGTSPDGVAATGSTLWVTTEPFTSTGHRGGTLTIAATVVHLGDIDPVLDYGNPQLFAVYHGLVGVHRADGARAFDLVPDLARTLPAATDGGRTYTFTLRPGLRYSTGRPVHAADFRAGLERAVRLAAQAGFPGYYQGVVGAARCARHRSQTCDLQRGIVTDERTRTVVFHLDQPDPDFLAKLAAWTFAIPVPRGTPQSDVGTNPIPGTGPYRIGGFRPNLSLSLIRNRFFRVWSTAAQPDGYPDIIRWIAMTSDKAAVSAVLYGGADLAYVAPQNITALRRAYPDRLWQSPTFGTSYLALNPRLAPFNNLSARRAVAYALSGNRDIAAQKGGGPSCTIVPPGWPGQNDRCPYPTDLTRARQLVRNSGTAGDTVHVYLNPNEPEFVRIGHITAAVLDKIGFRAQVDLSAAYNPTAAPSSYAAAHKPVNIGLFQWWPDFPAVSQYYLPVLSCAQGVLKPITSCNSAIDAAAATALRTQVTDPGAAQRDWQNVYYRAEADARLVPNSTAAGNSILVSPRVGNPHFSPFFGPLVDQLWVRPRHQ